MKDRLAFFDSGIGGFSVLKSICIRHSYFSAVYLADTARIPYGSKTYSEIRDIAFEISQWLSHQEISAVVVACNTTNSLALDVIKKYSSVPVFDLIGSAIDLIRESRIGVLATPSTVASKAYTNQIKSVNPYAFVREEACPEFVPFIESGQFDLLWFKNIVSNHLENLISQNIEAIILGCTHYPLIKPIFEELVPSNIRLIDPADALSKRLDSFLHSPPSEMDLENLPFDIQFMVTSDPIGFSLNTKKWLGINSKVEVVSLRSKSCVF